MAQSNPRTYPCERFDLNFIDAAPLRFASTVDLAISPEQLFEVVGDAESWPLHTLDRYAAERFNIA